MEIWKVRDGGLLAWKTIAISVIGFLIGFGLLVVGSIGGLGELWKELFVALGSAMLTIVGLHAIFDIYGKRDLLKEFSEEIRRELTRHLSGIVEAVDNAQLIQYQDDVWSSEGLIIGNRGSLRLVKNFSGHIASRARNGKKTILVFCSSDVFVRHYVNLAEKGTDPTAIDSWVDDFCKTERIPRTLIEIIRVNDLVNYSFVMFDSGIWIKLYNNSKSRVPAPALLAQRTSPVGVAISRDIERLIAPQD